MIINGKCNNSLAKSGKLGTIRESNQASGVLKEHYALYYVQKSSILLAGTDVRKISLVARGFSPIKIHFSDYPEKFNQQNK